MVERSATLSHLLQRTLAAAQLGADRVFASFGEAAVMLKNAQGSLPCRLLIVGAPQRPVAEFDQLLELLKTGVGKDLPVLLMAHERTTQIARWLDQRPRAAFLIWSSFGRIPALLPQLIPVGTAEDGTAGESPTATPLKLLFIDDSPSVRMAYRDLLGKHGFDVDVAGSLREGLSKATQQSFDLVVVDYFLPDGNGDELIVQLKAQPATRDVPIAVITGAYKDAIIKKCLDAGAVECMFKNEVLELTLARIKALARGVETQKRIEEERQRLNGILESVGDGVYGVDDQGIVTFANPAAVRLLGYVEDSELIGKSAHQRFHFAAEDGSSIDSGQSPLAMAYRHGTELKRLETVFWTRSGEALPVECSVVPLSIAGRRQGSVVVFRDISERKSADRLRWELSHDALTGLANRRHFNQVLAHEIERRRERGGYSAVLYIDLDRYSLIEENAGERAAQKLLIEVGQRFGERLRQDDVLARLDEDHFALLLSGVQLENMFTVADGFRELLHEVHYTSLGKRLGLTGSVGVSIISRDTPSAEYVLEHARLACATAKRRGMDQTQIYVAEADARIARELDAGWTARIREALHEDRFLLLVQPIVPLAGGSSGMRPRGEWHLGQGEHLFELLIRMLNRDGQWISPSVFVPLAERVGLIQKIDLWVISRTLRLLGELPPTPRFSMTVNLSNLTLQDPESLKHIEHLVSGSGVDPSRLVFEVTETSEIGSLHSARKFMQALRKLGCRFALDDFGTGFSSFSHLKHLPVDFVKIEGSFIAELGDSPTDQTMVHSIIDMAHSLQLQVIAEHVDSDATVGWLQRCGCDFGQGHFLGEPRPLGEVDLAALLGP